MHDPGFAEILILAVVATFLVARLYAIFGRRDDGGQPPRQRPNPYAQAAPAADKPAVTVADITQALTQAVPEEELDDGRPLSLAASLQRIQKRDPSFQEKDFLKGARAAFEMILGAYARGDSDQLRGLLAPGVFDRFDASIQERKSQQQSLDSRILRVREAEIIKAVVSGTDARVTVRYLSEQIHVLRDTSGQIISGDPTRAEETEDCWTFRRELGAADPNWQLVETGT